MLTMLSLHDVRYNRRPIKFIMLLLLLNITQDSPSEEKRKKRNTLGGERACRRLVHTLFVEELSKKHQHHKS